MCTSNEERSLRPQMLSDKQPTFHELWVCTKSSHVMPQLLSCDNYCSEVYGAQATSFSYVIVWKGHRLEPLTLHTDKTCHSMEL